MQVCGAIGPVASIGRQAACVSELEMGIGNTNAWKLNVLDQNTSVAFFFEVKLADGKRFMLMGWHRSPRILCPAGVKQSEFESPSAGPPLLYAISHDLFSFERAAAHAGRNCWSHMVYL